MNKKTISLVFAGIAAIIIGMVVGTMLEQYRVEQEQLEDQRLLELSRTKKPVKTPLPPPEPPTIPEPAVNNDLPFPVDPTNI